MTRLYGIRLDKRESTPETGDLYSHKGSGKKARVKGVDVWLKGESPSPENNSTSPLYERAAYLVDRMLNIGLIPTTILRLHEGKLVSAQKFIKGAAGWKSKIEQPALLCVLDYIINNGDRHGSNWIVADNGKVWAIDNALSFHAGFSRSNYLCDLPERRRHSLVNRIKVVLKNKAEIHRKLDPLIKECKVTHLIDRLELLVRVSKELDKESKTKKAKIKK